MKDVHRSTNREWKTDAWHYSTLFFGDGRSAGGFGGVKETMSPGLINVISPTSEDCLTTIIPAPHVSGLTTLLI